MSVAKPSSQANLPRLSLLSAALLLLSACGGGRPDVATEPNLAPLASATTTLQLQTDDLPSAAAQTEVKPAFHVAPLLLDEPGDGDRLNPNASALSGPRRQSVPAELSSLSTRGLTVQTLEAASRSHALSVNTSASTGVSPMAGSGVVSTYSPAQIRAAYGLPALPVAGASLTAAQAAQLGAGQTVYIVDAYHDPYIAAELAAFNSKFGLPTCTTKAIASSTALPLAAASSKACEFSQVYSTPAGGMTASAPAYNSGWATEIALDVQWAHAIAPLARIVLIESADASLNALLGAVKLANAMGPGVVSMSFGANEGTYTASVDAAFAAAKMSYLAATGDSGAAVSWPAVSPNVLAVSGTSLTYSGTGTRSELTWSGTGGGVSAYTATPSYQKSTVPGMGTPLRRSVADVAFNADPSTGQYVAVLTSSGGAVNWISAGGTSLATPQWAGLLAVANAVRAQVAKPVLGQAHGALYASIASVPGNYAAAFADINKGSNGTCASCAAKIGYDTATGLGTPNAASLLSQLSGVAAPVSAPVVTPASISGQVGKALSFTASASGPNALSFSLSAAPAGMTIAASTGVVSWPSPAAGSYAVSVIAKDAKTGLSGQAVYSVNIAAAPAPVAPTVSAANLTGKPGVALSYSLITSAANPLTYSLSAAPSGMTVSSSGVLSWAKPVLGSYSVTVTVKDGKTGLSGQALISVKIAASGPQITAPAVSGVAGKPLSALISISDPGVSAVSISISGVPLGMMFSANGMNITASWAKPITGSYTLKIVVQDSTGQTATASLPITVSAK
ncbi:peptidase S53 [Paucibacter sp. KBW04]|uniref:S53 family peptidase n=1 Tax=Paucibacter sp. KBW04 TaxID=2153361 RepID=UPI000F581FAA|nr:S53 family peptidase [Paucibacter sp. KBW04]RQO53678.1 peptidase S53 [Paucibacter sp. KBW04]